MRRVLCKHCCRPTAETITYSECTLVALGIQHAQRMRRIIRRAQVKVGQINLCKGLFSLNVHEE
jgi:hypothetical protein